MPKAELARLTGLTAQTIGLITTRLDEDRPAGARARRCAAGLVSHRCRMGLNPEGAFAIGIKIASPECGPTWLLVDFLGRGDASGIRDGGTTFPDAQVPAAR